MTIEKTMIKKHPTLHIMKINPKWVKALNLKC